MSITINGIPEQIPRRDVQDFLQKIGIDPNEVAGLVFHPEGVEIEAYADGKPHGPGYRWTANGKEVAVHRLTIPIVDEKEAS